jgi:[acyl-carrier-protein] S-malonyltransferase
MTAYALVFGSADVSHDMADMVVLYDQDEHVHQRFDHVARVAEVTVGELLRKEPPTRASHMQLISLGLAAGMLGLADQVVAERGHPVCAGGISVGELVALTACGALSVEEMVSIIQLRVDRPQSSLLEHAEAVGFVLGAAGMDTDYYRRHPDLYVSIDFGPIQSGAGRLLMLSGLRTALETFGTRGPGILEVVPSSLCQAGYHCVLRTPVRDAISTYLDQRGLSTPAWPVVSCLDASDPVVCVNDVKSVVVRAETEPLGLSNLLSGIRAHVAEEVVAIGPFLRSLTLDFGVPTTYLDKEWVAQRFAGSTAENLEQSSAAERFAGGDAR